MTRYQVHARLDMWALVPFDVAMKDWKEMPQVKRLDDRPPPIIPVERGSCPVCSFHASERGFVRLPFPISHRMFGKAICCPRCWPAPLGHAAIGALSEQARKVAAMWRDAGEL